MRTVFVAVKALATSHDLYVCNNFYQVIYEINVHRKMDQYCTCTQQTENYMITSGG